MTIQNEIHGNRWRGGRLINARGYVIIYRPGYYLHTDYVAEHRLVAEQIIGRRLKKNEDVHHINGVKTDNRPENLEVITHGKHSARHALVYRKKVMFKRKCIDCNSDKTKFDRKYNRYQWYFLDSNESKPLCNNCYQRRWKAKRRPERIIIEKICALCKSIKTWLDKKGKPRWFFLDKNRDKYICGNCNQNRYRKLLPITYSHISPE